MALILFSRQKDIVRLQIKTCTIEKVLIPNMMIQKEIFEFSI